MPCRDLEDYNGHGGSWNTKNKKQNKAKQTAVQNKLNDVTAMLCAVCNIFDNDVSFYDRNIETSNDAAEAVFKIKGLNKWWKEHSEFDKKRLEAAKRSAMSKLTKEEKEALGLGN